MIHAGVVLVAILWLAPLFSYLPMAALAALLVIVARNMSEAPHVMHVLRIAPRSDVLVLLTCLILTVLFDMVLAVGVGLLLAAGLFIKRMSELTDTTALSGSSGASSGTCRACGHLRDPRAAVLWRRGKGSGSAAALQSRGQVVIVDISAVPMLDMTARHRWRTCWWITAAWASPSFSVAAVRRFG